MDIRAIIGTNVRKLRNGNLLSQEELAFRSGIDRSYLSEIECGHKNLSVITLERLAAALGVRISALLFGYNGEKEPQTD